MIASFEHMETIDLLYAVQESIELLDNGIISALYSIIEEVKDSMVIILENRQVIDTKHGMIGISYLIAEAIKTEEGRRKSWDKALTEAVEISNQMNLK